MPAPLLATKLHAPSPRPEAVARPRLVERIGAGAGRKLTLVSAPAGSGKTTLVADWRAASGTPTGWLSLDADDGDLRRFFDYLVAALRSLDLDAGGAPLGARTAAVLDGAGHAAEAVLPVLVNEAADAKPFALVLDDYHALDAPPIDRALAFLVDHLPPHAHLVVTTREDPPLPLARLRARGDLAEVRAADLRFTPDETAALLRADADLALDADAVAALAARTEGWAAGLRLAALSLRSQPDPAAFVASFTGSHRFVADYLVEEVLRQQPAPIQTFLLRTSVLGRLCGPLCDAVVDEAATPGQETLEALARTNLFVVPLDDERRWFRYHHLFADLLRQRLPRSLAEDDPDVADLHGRASTWFEREGLDAEAVRHALDADDVGRAAGLLERTLEPMHRQMWDAEWLGWARSLPEAEVRARPVLAAGVAWALLNAGALDEAEDWLDEAERPSEVHDEPPETTLAAARAFLAGARGNPEATIAHARRALDGLPPAAVFERGRAGALLGLALWAQGDLANARRTFADGLDAIREAGNDALCVSGAFVLGEMDRAAGRLGNAVRTNERAIAEAEALGLTALPYSVVLHAGLARARCEQGDLDAAAEHLDRSRRVAEEAGPAAPPSWRLPWGLAAGRLAEARGEYDVALDHLDEAERARVHMPVPDAEPTAALRARIWLRQGRLADVAAWVKGLDSLPEAEIPYLREFEALVRARFLLARHDAGDDGVLPEAAELLERVLDGATAADRAGRSIQALVLLALVHDAAGESDGALAPLRRALVRAEIEGAAQVFRTEGDRLEPLLSRAAIGGEGAAFAHTVMDDGTASGNDTEAGPLTAREAEVLGLVAAGLRNREIADRLFVSLPTVKRHLANAYGKLDVRNRVEAVARAHEMGLG